MQQVEKIEKMVATWMKDMPHLPKGLTKWLAENAWWLVIIGVVLSVLSLLMALTALTVGSVVLGTLGAAALGGTLFVGALISLVGSAASAVIEGLAISPLKVMNKKGWDLLFLSVLVGFAGAVVSSLIGMNIMGVVWAAVAAAISFYVLLEVKPYFVGAAKHETKA
jgi:hypothetical protein